MGVAILKDPTGYIAVAPKTTAYLVRDVLPDQLTIRVNVTDELLGAMVRDKGRFFTVTVVGEDVRAALEAMKP